MATSLSRTLRRHRSLLSIRSLNHALRTPPQLSTLSTSEATLPPPPPPPPRPPTSAASEVQEKERGRWSKLLLFLPGAATFGLGTWQLFRRQEKIEMLDYRMKRLGMEPIMWNEVASLKHDLDSLEFRRVVCDGVFDDSKSVYIGPRSRSISGVTENGFYVITPLFPVGSELGSVQRPVLVNRGWVPRHWRDKTSEDSKDEKHADMETGNVKQNQDSSWWKFWLKKPSALKAKEPIITPVRVIGVVRGSEKPSIFVPANDPNVGQWFYVDVPMIARACNLPEDTVYIEDINEDVNAGNPYPIPKDVNTLIRHSVMPQDHLNYAITWYSLSAAVTFMAVRRIRPKKTRR